MSRILTRSFRKQLEKITHQPIPKLTQEQDEQQVQPMGNKPRNAPNTNVTQRVEANEQHQNATKLVVQKNPTTFSTTHQVTPHTSTQPRAMNVHHDDNHEPI
jgi:hypothetical protein